MFDAIPSIGGSARNPSVLTMDTAADYETAFFVPITVAGLEEAAFIDSGASNSHLPEDLLQRLPPEVRASFVAAPAGSRVALGAHGAFATRIGAVTSPWPHPPAHLRGVLAATGRTRHHRTRSSVQVARHQLLQDFPARIPSRAVRRPTIRAPTSRTTTRAPSTTRGASTPTCWMPWPGTKPCRRTRCGMRYCGMKAGSASTPAGVEVHDCLRKRAERVLRQALVPGQGIQQVGVLAPRVVDGARVVVRDVGARIVGRRTALLGTRTRKSCNADAEQLEQIASDDDAYARRTHQHT